MFSVRDITPDDLPQVYDFTVKLLRHHLGQNAESSMTAVELSRLFQNGFLKGLLLIRTPVAEQNSNLALTHSDSVQTVGFMIFHADISLLRGGCGICLDQFYIEPEYRRLGLGRRMMAVLGRRVLASNGNYIKLVYQDGLGLDSVYGKMGFVNHSRGDAGVHLFESYGKSNLQEFIERVENSGQKTSTTNRTQVLVIPFAKTSSDQDAVLPAWSTMSSPICGHAEGPNCDILPGARLVIVAEAGPCYPPGAVPNTGLLPRFHSKLCMFVEQTCICCWLGPMVNFADFVGDTTILDPELFLQRIRCWVGDSPQIRGAVWEVPTEPCIGSTDDSENTTTTPLASRLRNLNVPDDTAGEGWNIAYLDVSGMRKLVETTATLEDVEE